MRINYLKKSSAAHLVFCNPAKFNLPQADASHSNKKIPKAKVNFHFRIFFCDPAGLTSSIPACLTKQEEPKAERNLSFLGPSCFVTPAGFKPTTF